MKVDKVPTKTYNLEILSEIDNVVDIA